MGNPLLSEYHVWEQSNGKYAVVDTYFQQVLMTDLIADDAFARCSVLRQKQKGNYPSIIEA